MFGFFNICFYLCPEENNVSTYFSNIPQKNSKINIKILCCDIVTYDIYYSK